MKQTGGKVLVLLLVAAAASAKFPDKIQGKPALKDAAKKLMMKCHNNGYQEPDQMQLNTVFSESDVSVNGRVPDSPSLLSTFVDTLNLITGRETSRMKFLQDDLKPSNMMWNCSKLLNMIKHMKNSSMASSCYMQAFMAPMAWATLTSQSDQDVDSDDYKTLLWAAKPALEDLPPSRIDLPPRVRGQNMENMMSMLCEVYDPMSENQRKKVFEWAKEQIAENNHNCTMKSGQSKNRAHIQGCEPTLKWLDADAMAMMGPYLTQMRPGDVDSLLKEKLCEFFNSDRFNSTFSKVNSIHPSLSRKFLQRLQECFSGEREFTKHVDKLGSLACYYYNVPQLSAEDSKKLLSQLDDCDNPRIKQLKKRLLSTVMSTSSSAQTLKELGSSITLLSPKQLSDLPASNLSAVLKTLGPDVRWKRGQLRALIKKKLGDRMCKEVSAEELKSLQSIAEGLPNCLLKHVKAKEILNDREALENISQKMRKGQLKAMLQGLREQVNTSQLVEKLSGPLLQSVSLTTLKEANIMSMDQVENKTWTQTQAAYLAKKMKQLRQLQFRRLRSVLQGITCNMMEKVTDTEVDDLAEAMTETPQWVSKVLAGCAAHRLFTSLENKRADYFKTISEVELNEIPAVLLLHLPPDKMQDLPDSVCPTFLDKMQDVNMSSLPLRSPSRPYIAQKALLCLANGTDLSTLASDDMSKLGELVCELTASQLRSLSPEVIRSTLEDVASCRHIPQRHRDDLIKLLNQTYGDPTDWSAETMEAVGPLLLLDDNATAALPNKPWMTDVLRFLRPRLMRVSKALRRKIFELTVSGASNESRRRRAAHSLSGKTPTEELINELGPDNDYWTAAQLESMTKETFISTVDTLGDVLTYRQDQLEALVKKTVEAYGPVSSLSDSTVVQLGCITQGFSDSDLQNVPFPLDSVSEISRCGWNKTQVALVWKAVSKYNNLTAASLGVAEMVAVDRFICGLTSSETEQLNKDTFKEAVGSMDGFHCSFDAAQQFKGLAVSAFGEPSSWTEAEVSDLGNVIVGLDSSELSSLKPSVFPFISDACIPLIPPQNFAALSVDQLQALGPDNSAVVTVEQRAALSEEQRDALEKAASGTMNRETSPDQSGAPSLSIEGVSAFMKPLLFLIVGFLLL